MKGYYLSVESNDHRLMHNLCVSWNVYERIRGERGKKFTWTMASRRLKDLEQEGSHEEANLLRQAIRSVKSQARRELVKARNLSRLIGYRKL